MADDAAPTELARIGAAVDWPDHEAAATARERMAASAGRYGRLEDLAEWIAGVQGAAPPKDLIRPRIVVFLGAGEHRPATTARGADSGIAELLGVGRRLVDVAPGAAPLTTDELRRAVCSGAALADEEVDSGADLLVAVLPGPDAAAVSIIAVLTNSEPVAVLARGAAATDPEIWMQRAVTVRDARRRGFEHRAHPSALLIAIGDTALATAAGFILQASARRTPVLLDGLGATAAALLAYEAQPRAVRWWRPAGSVPGPAHDLALTMIGLRPVLDLGLDLGDGAAGALAVPVLRAAIGALGALGALRTPEVPTPTPAVPEVPTPTSELTEVPTPTPEVPTPTPEVPTPTPAAPAEMPAG